MQPSDMVKTSQPLNAWDKERDKYLASMSTALRGNVAPRPTFAVLRTRAQGFLKTKRLQSRHQADAVTDRPP